MEILTPATLAVNGIGTGGVTNYEAGMLEGLQWIYTNADPDTQGTIMRSEASGGPLEGAVNQTLFYY